MLLDGELVCACLVLAAQADGHDVVTVEGLGAGDDLHPVQQAFVDGGRRAVRLLHARARRRDRGAARADAEPERGRDPRGALGQPLPLHRLPEDLRRGAAGGGADEQRRCASRARASSSSAASARASSGSTASRRRPASSRTPATSRPRGCSGATRCAARTRTRASLSIDLSAALTLPGVHAVLTHADVPGQKTYGLEFADQPVLAIDRVRYFGEPVAVVAAEHPEQARRAAERDRRRVRAARAGRRSRSARPSRSRCIPTGRPRATATATTRGRTSSARC